jgi:DNA-binding NarL/FixJ family response regulator
MPHPRILIIEDHPLMADAIAVSVQSCLPQAQCVMAHRLQTALEFLSSPMPWSLVLVDLNLPDSQGLQTLYAVCELRSQGALMVLSALQDPEVQEACSANGVVFLNKALPSSAFLAVLLQALHQVLSSEALPLLAQEAPVSHGLPSLSTQQRLVLAQLSKGWTSRRIAHQLQLSEATVRSHTREVLRKLGVENRTQASQLYLQWLQQKASDA